MVIAKCGECGTEYQLDSGEDPSDFQCECGGNLSKNEVEPVTHVKPDKSWKEKAEDIKSGVSELNELFEYEESASRIELFVRIFYAIPVGIILICYGILAGISLVLQWILILLLGKRVESLNNFIKGYLRYTVHLLSYFSVMTDKRPGVSPRKVQIYELIE